MTNFYKATKDDFKDLFKLVMAFELDKQVLYDYDDKFDKSKMLKENKKNLKEFLNDKTCNYIVCEKGDVLVGYIFLSFSDIYDGEGYVNEIYVIPSERKKGIANKFLENGVSWLKLNNCKTIDITVNRKNKLALNLYKNHGFGKFKDSYISMRKKI
jgi:ribosomal protein S18 acetylase RimI-like enzyme